jgi:hypothetical protein
MRRISNDKRAAGGMMMRYVALAALAVLFVTATAGADIYEDLVTRGVTLGSGQVVRLPKPIMADGLSAKDQTAVLSKAADKYPLDRFLKNVVVSPYVLDVNAVGDAGGEHRGQQIDFYFVAYGTLDAVTDSDLLTGIAGESEGAGPDSPPANARALTDDELKSRGLPPSGASATDPTYLMIDVPILERVRLGGIAQGVQYKTDAAVLGALKLDESFGKDPKFPNSWRQISRDKLGKSMLGPHTPYSGMGGYMKVTKLIEPAGAVFIECHLVFDEPHSWFDGKNLLRSKLPLIVQDSVRKFRRKLGAASQ